MRTEEFIGLLGWVTAISFGIAILNYFMKFINKKYISKLGKDKEQLVNLYRKIMKLVIKNHKLAGTISVVAVISHFFISVYFNRISITGIIAALLMLSIFLLGFYGAYVNKNYKGKWLTTHRILAFALIIAIAIHII